MKKVLVLSSDKRMLLLAKELSRRGVDVNNSDSLDNAERSDIIMLPYLSFVGGKPVGAEDFNSVFKCLTLNGMIFAGKYPKEFADECFKRKISLVDWFSDEELTVKNAYLTAEGALGIAIDKMPYAVKDSLVVILGYGRVAKACADVFMRMGAHISVMARSYSARMDAYARGCKAFDIKDNEPLQDADLIVNTVPSPLLDAARLEYLKKDAWVAELASKPYGVDFAAADEMGINYVIAGGLPAKTSPATAAVYMADAAMKYLGGMLSE